MPLVCVSANRAGNLNCRCMEYIDGVICGISCTRYRNSVVARTGRVLISHRRSLISRIGALSAVPAGCALGCWSCKKVSLAVVTRQTFQAVRNKLFPSRWVISSRLTWLNNLGSYFTVSTRFADFTGYCVGRSRSCCTSFAMIPSLAQTRHR